MRAREFIPGRTRGLGDITLIYSDRPEASSSDKEYHLEKRQGERDVTDQERDNILAQIHLVRRPIMALSRGQQFWIYDPQLDKAVGLTVVSRDRKIYRVNTVMGKRPWESDVSPTVSLPVRSIRENTTSGSIATVAVPLGGVITRQIDPKPTKYSNGAPVLNRRKKTHARG